MQIGTNAKIPQVVASGLFCLCSVCFFLFGFLLFGFSITFSKEVHRGLKNSQFYYLWTLKHSCCIPDNCWKLDLSGKVNWNVGFPNIFFPYSLAIPWWLMQKFSISLVTAVLLIFGTKGMLDNSIYLCDCCLWVKCSVHVRCGQATVTTATCCWHFHRCFKDSWENSRLLFLGE